MRKLLIALLALLLILAITCASAANDKGPNQEAQSAADAVEIPEGLTDAEAEIYRLGYAMGYYDALHPQDTLDEYVINTNTMKFHYPTCQSAASIAPHNRDVFHGSRDELIARGYAPCGVCKP